MRLPVICFVISAILIQNSNGMTEKQLKAALKLVRNVCQPKHKATNEQIDAMHQGDWNQDKNGQCYMYCILNMYKMIGKDNSFDWEGAVKQLEAQAPPSIGPAAIISVQNCKDAVQSKEDKCGAGFEIAKCIYMDNPGNYFLP